MPKLVSEDSSQTSSKIPKSQNRASDKEASSSKKKTVEILPAYRRSKVVQPPSKNQLKAMKIYNTPLPLPKVNDRGARVASPLNRRQTARAASTSVDSQTPAVDSTPPTNLNIVFNMMATPAPVDSDTPGTATVEHSENSPAPQQSETVMSASQLVDSNKDQEAKLPLA